MEPGFIESRASLLLDALCEVIGSDVEGESDGQGESDTPIDGRVSPDAVPTHDHAVLVIRGEYA